MTGIGGILHHRGVGLPFTDELRTRLDNILRPLSHHDWHAPDGYVDVEQGVGLGQVNSDFMSSTKGVASVEEGRWVAAMEGELYDVESVRARLRQAGGRGGEFDNQAALLLHGFRTRGTEFLRELHGSFVAAIWNSEDRELVLINDRFATRGLYYSPVANGLLFASSMRSLMTDPNVSRSASAAGAAQFFTFGHYLGQETSQQAVKILPPAACYRFHPDTARLQRQTYWNVSEDVADRQLEPQEYLEAIDVAFQQAIDRRVLADERVGVALSGGMDSRTILGGVSMERADVQSVCLGVAGCIDHTCAQRMAQLVGCRHTNHVLSDDFLRSFPRHLQEMVQLTDGQYLSQCIVMPTLPLYRELGINVLLRGHGGELMHMDTAYNYSVDQQLLEMSDQQQFRAWLMQRLPAYLLDGVRKPLFADGLQESIDELASDSLDEELGEVAGDGPIPQQLWRLFVRLRLGRETPLSLAKFRSVTETRLPYMDNDLVSLLMAAPVSLKCGEPLQTHILRRRCPQLLKVVNANTGTYMGAARWRRQLGQLRKRVLAKLRVPGYQPYERMGQWLRQELAPLVKETLLSDQCLQRGVFSPEGVRDVVSRHLGGQANHTYLLLAMLVYESGQRFLLEQENVSERLLVSDQYAGRTA